VACFAVEAYMILMQAIVKRFNSNVARCDRFGSQQCTASLQLPLCGLSSSPDETCPRQDILT
jgi:hypothetical protein